METLLKVFFNVFIIKFSVQNFMKEVSLLLFVYQLSFDDNTREFNFNRGNETIQGMLRKKITCGNGGCYKVGKNF